MAFLFGKSVARNADGEAFHFAEGFVIVVTSRPMGLDSAPPLSIRAPPPNF
jgi:hypothetical protein